VKMLVIGSTGDAGSRILTEALSRGHTVTGASRSQLSGTLTARRAPWVALDVTDTEQVARAASGHDVIVGATRPAPGREDDVVAMTRGLAAAAARAGRRLLVVGGAAPLRVPGTTHRVLDDTTWVPVQIRLIAGASDRQLAVLREHPDTDWVYIAPTAIFAPGRRSGRYRTSDGELVIAADGTSALSMEDYAIALIDEAEQPGPTRRVLAIGPA